MAELSSALGLPSLVLEGEGAGQRAGVRRLPRPPPPFVPVIYKAPLRDDLGQYAASLFVGTRKKCGPEVRAPPPPPCFSLLHSLLQAACLHPRGQAWPPRG